MLQPETSLPQDAAVAHTEQLAPASPAQPHHLSPAVEWLYSPVEGPRDRGGTSAKVVFVAASTALAAVVGWGLGVWGNNRPRTEASKSGSVTAAKDLAIVPIALDCRSVRISDASGSKRVYERKAFDKTLSNMSSTVIFEKYVVTSTDCVKGGDQAAMQAATKVIPGQSKPGETYKPKVIEIPIEQLVNMTAPVPGPDTNKVLTDHDDIPDLFFNNAGNASVALKALCTVVSLGQKGDECNAWGEKLGRGRTTIEAELRATAELALLNDIRKQCGVNSWPNTKAAILDSYKDSAVKLAGGDKKAADAVTVIFTKNGVESNDPPAFDNAYDEELKKLGLVPEDGSTDFVTNFKVQCATTPPYVPKYPTNSSTPAVSTGAKR